MSGLGNVLGKVLPALLVAVGAFSGTADAQCYCGGTVRFKAPSNWSEVYFGTRNCSAAEAGHVAAPDADGYFTYDLCNIGHLENSGAFFSILNSVTQGSISVIKKSSWVTPTNDGVPNAFSNNLDFTCPGAGNITYVAENPLVPGTVYTGSVPPSAKYLYILVPDDKLWQSDVMMLRYTDGSGLQKDTSMAPAPGMCGWFYMVYDESKVPNDIIIYRKNKPDDQIGATGLWGNDADATPIPLKTILDGYHSDRLYFIPDDSQWPEGREDEQGIFVTDPSVDGVCTFELAAVIYDTDESLWTSKVGHIFSTNDENDSYAGQCLGVRTGIVETDLGSDGKPKLNTTPGGNGIKCFGSADNFNKLFNYVEGLNEVQCYNMPFRHYGTDPRWGFDSDSANMAGNFGGFHPVDNTSDATVVKELSPVACPTCRQKRYAQGPVPFTIAAETFDKYCKGPGWASGIDCGAIASGNLTYFGNGDNPAVWDWGAARWEGQHNQQFCFESHATFTYSEDQEFTFRGDDDIWVFINKKLAVDNGGTHLAAPSHVQLKQLNGTYGPDFLVPGQDYPLDIFFCDRRTTMSNVIIKTNMFIKQVSGLNANGKKKSDGSSVDYELCYDQSGDGSCASVALGATGGGDGTIHACGEGIKQYGDLKYMITTRKGDTIAVLKSGQSGWQYGGIDISNVFKPIVNADKINGLTPGSYYLVINFCDKSGTCKEKDKTKISFRIKGNLDVMTQTSTYVVNDGDEESPAYRNNTKWTFVGEGLAGSRVPVYVSAFADGGVDLLSAIGQSYTLTLDAGMKAYTSKTGDAEVTWPRKVGNSGIDTVWVGVGLDKMSQSPEEKTVSLKSQAKIKFYAPELDFAEPKVVDENGHVKEWTYPITGDPLTMDGEEYFHWIGSDVDLYVLIVNPATGKICEDCRLDLGLVDSPSGVKQSGDVIYLGEGAYLISINSRKEYMDTTAWITVGSLDDENGLTYSSYKNLRFRKPPVPYPQLVDIFDAKGETLGSLSIIEPYFSKTKEYLDGKADSIAIHYDRPFAPNPQGEYKDSLPFLICIDWDEDVFDEYDFTKIKKWPESAKPGSADTLAFSKTKKDSAVVCSYVIDSATVYKAFERRYKANGNKSDSVLTFVADSTFSVAVKTVGRGKVLSFATYEDRKKITKGHFDGSITDRIAPVIVSARIENSSDDISRLTVQLSEPAKLTDSTNKMAPFTFYMNSATEVSDAKKYASSTARREPTGIGTDKIIILYDKTQGAKNPTPRMGDYIRFRADSWAWRDTVNTSSDVAARSSSDASMHWNSPTDYNSSKRLPSAWVNILGEYAAEVSAIKLATINKDLPPNTPPVETFVIPTTFNKDSIMANHPGTLGFIVQSDIAAFISSDEKIDSCFNANPDALEDVYFQYEVQYFTNLGSYVAGDKQKIYCKDPKFFGEGKTCREVHGNFYIAWNMLSDKKRLVGTGAYIAKIKSFVNLGDKCADGKVKSSKAEDTDMWGAKRGKGVIKK